MRLSTIAALMERIAPSERGAIEIVDRAGTPLLIWALLPADVAPVHLYGSVDDFGFRATPRVGDPGKFGQAKTIASAMHSDAEVARLLLAHGAEILQHVEASAQKSEATEQARAVAHYRRLITEALAAPEPGPPQNPIPPDQRAQYGQQYRPQQAPQPPHGFPSGRAQQLEEIRAARSKAMTWLWVNIGMIVVAGIITIASYAGTEPGGRFILWWGPIIFGVINVFRFAIRLSTLGELEQDLVRSPR